MRRTKLRSANTLDRRNRIKRLSMNTLERHHRTKRQRRDNIPA
jgi:hypothetical protein